MRKTKNQKHHDKTKTKVTDPFRHTRDDNIWRPLSPYPDDDLRTITTATIPIDDAAILAPPLRRRDRRRRCLLRPVVVVVVLYVPPRGQIVECRPHRPRTSTSSWQYDNDQRGEWRRDEYHRSIFQQPPPVVVESCQYPPRRRERAAGTTGHTRRIVEVRDHRRRRRESTTGIGTARRSYESSRSCGIVDRDGTRRRGGRERRE